MKVNDQPSSWAANDTIHAARFVTKTATYRLGAFQSRDLGPIGYVDADGVVTYFQAPTPRHTLDTEFGLEGLITPPRVDVALSYLGADDSAIDAFVVAGAEGIVSAGTGAGRPTPAEDEALTRAHEGGVVICQASRVGSGRVVRSPALVRRGFVAAGNLQPWKARILLSLALTLTREPVEIQQMFDRY